VLALSILIKINQTPAFKYADKSEEAIYDFEHLVLLALNSPVHIERKRGFLNNIKYNILKIILLNSKNLK